MNQTPSNSLTTRVLRTITDEFPVHLYRLAKGGDGLLRCADLGPVRTQDDVAALVPRGSLNVVRLIKAGGASCYDERGLTHRFVLASPDFALPNYSDKKTARKWRKRALAAWDEMFAAVAREVLEPPPIPPAEGDGIESQADYLAARFDNDETNLWMLAEEAGEVVRSCGKIGRWGYDHRHQVTGEKGMTLLENEIGDFLAIVEIMTARGHFDLERIRAAVLAKWERLEKWYDAPWTPEDKAPVDAPVVPSPDPYGIHKLIDATGEERECKIETFDGATLYRVALKPTAGSFVTTRVKALWDLDQQVFRELIDALPPTPAEPTEPVLCNDGKLRHLRLATRSGGSHTAVFSDRGACSPRVFVRAVWTENGWMEEGPES